MNSELLQFVLLLACVGAFSIWIYKERRKQQPRERDLSLYDFDDTLERPGITDTYL
jgi:hypothetical protein